MTRQFHRMALYTTIARYVINGVAWWVQRHPTRQAHQLCERCAALVVHREPGHQRGALPLVAVLVDEYAALVNAVSESGKNQGMKRKILELLASGTPFTVTVTDPKRGN